MMLIIIENNMKKHCWISKNLQCFKLKKTPNTTHQWPANLFENEALRLEVVLHGALGKDNRVVLVLNCLEIRSHDDGQCQLLYAGDGQVELPRQQVDGILEIRDISLYMLMAS